MPGFSRLMADVHDLASRSIFRTAELVSGVSFLVNYRNFASTLQARAGLPQQKEEADRFELRTSPHLPDQWNGPIITNQVLFTIFDALMVFIGLVVFNLVHPGVYFPHVSTIESIDMDGKLGNFDSHTELNGQ